jgi:serine protease Do
MKHFRFLLLGICVAISPEAGWGQSPNTFSRSHPQLLGLFAEVIQKASEATVRVTSNGKEVALGTIVDPDGWILTKHSELRDDIKVRLKDGREFPATLIGVHSDDLAMLKIDAAGLPVVEWRNSNEVGVGSWVASPGLGRDPLAVGVISVMSRDLPPTPRFLPNPSGGYMGIIMSPTEGGVRIVQVAENTPAAKAGLKEGDIIRAIDDQVVTNNDDVLAYLRNKKPGEKIRIHFLRDGVAQEVPLELARRPPEANRGDFQNRMGSALSDRRGGFATILQHDTVLRPADCGGPLVDLDGKVIGINIARAGRTETFAIPSEKIIPLIAGFKAGKFPVPKPPVTSLEDRMKALQEAIKQATAEEEESRKAREAAAQKEADARKRREALEAELKQLKEKK